MCVCLCIFQRNCGSLTFPIHTIKGFPPPLPLPPPANAKSFHWLPEALHDVRQVNPLCKNSNLPVDLTPFYVCAPVCGECDTIMTEELPAVWLSNPTVPFTPTQTFALFDNIIYNIIKPHLMRQSIQSFVFVEPVIYFEKVDLCGIVWCKLMM